MDRSIYIPSGLTLLAGIWLIASPWVFAGFPASPGGAWNSIVVGILVALFGGGNLWGAKSRALGWLTVILGGWMTAAPFIFDYATNQPWTWSSVVTGVIVVGLGIIEISTARPALAHGAHGPWVGRRLGPGFAYEHEDRAPGRERRGWDGEFRGVGPRGWRRPDPEIMSDVCGCLAEHPRLDASEVEVLVVDGEVSLLGAVGSRGARRLAEEIADSVSGVRDVSNQLRVRGGRAA